MNGKTRKSRNCARYLSFHPNNVGSLVWSSYTCRRLCASGDARVDEARDCAAAIAGRRSTCVRKLHQDEKMQHERAVGRAYESTPGERAAKSLERPTQEAKQKRMQLIVISDTPSSQCSHDPEHMGKQGKRKNGRQRFVSAREDLGCYLHPASWSTNASTRATRKPQIGVLMTNTNLRAFKDWREGRSVFG